VAGSNLGVEIGENAGALPAGARVRRSRFDVSPRGGILLKFTVNVKQVR